MGAPHHDPARLLRYSDAVARARAWDERYTAIDTGVWRHVNPCRSIRHGRVLDTLTGRWMTPHLELAPARAQSFTLNQRQRRLRPGAPYLPEPPPKIA